MTEKKKPNTTKKRVNTNKSSGPCIPTVEEMFKARVHLGHQTRRWSPLMRPYIHSVLKKTHIFDLNKTAASLLSAADFLTKVKTDNKKIIFIGTKRQVKDIVKKLAEDTDSFYVSERWVGGILTNFGNFKKNLARLEETDKKLKEDGYHNLTKKEVLIIRRQLEKDIKFFGGLRGLSEMPAAAIIVDPRREKVALLEANKMNIPVVAIVDTNTNPTGVDYVVPANDDAISSLELILGTLAKALK